MESIHSVYVTKLATIKKLKKWGWDTDYLLILFHVRILQGRANAEVLIPSPVSCSFPTFPQWLPTANKNNWTGNNLTVSVATSKGDLQSAIVKNYNQKNKKPRSFFQYFYNIIPQMNFVAWVLNTKLI